MKRLSIFLPLLLLLPVPLPAQDLQPHELELLFQTNCRLVTDKLKCSQSKFCVWSNWRPKRCTNKCSQFRGFKEECSKYHHCQYKDETNTCSSRSCKSCESEEVCTYNIACAWVDGECKDESCLTQLAEQKSECPTSYCKWHEPRKLCYDKFCEDYYSKSSCEEISFCEWYKYRCINKSFDKKLLQ